MNSMCFQSGLVVTLHKLLSAKGVTFPLFNGTDFITNNKSWTVFVMLKGGEKKPLKVFQEILASA